MKNYAITDIIVYMIQDEKDEEEIHMFMFQTICS